MKVILLGDVEKLGNEGDIVTVKNGYGRNWLIPQGLAVIATRGAIRAHEDQLQQQARRRAQQRNDADLLQAELEKITLEVEARVGEENRIYGTITPQQIALSLAVHGFNIDRRTINIAEGIRVLGEYTATIKLYADVQAQIKVRVIPVGSARS